jgi:glucokinase
VLTASTIERTDQRSRSRGSSAGREAYAGADLGGTKIGVLVVDGREHAVLGEARHPTPRSGGPEAIVAAVRDATEEAARAAGLEPDELAGVGVGSPGRVDGATGVVSQPPNLAGWDEPYPFAASLAEELGIPAVVANDVDAAIEAERELGAGRRFDSFLGVWWGTGVGGALVLNGERWHGRGAAGELGHTVVKIDGARCGCGRRGCVEAYAGRGSMERHARKAVDDGEKTRLFELAEKRGRDRLTSSVWERALEHGDDLAIRLLDEAYGALGAGVASAINLLDLEAVVLGGGLGTRFGQPAAERLAAEMKPHLFVDDRPPAVIASELGDAAGALGGALLAAAHVGAGR